MNIALIGYGKMGRVIESIALQRGHNITVALNSASSDSDWQRLRDADVCIEFTRPDAVLRHIDYCLKNNIKLVTGTTGWYDRMNEVVAQCEMQGGSFFWASNFSVGVHLFWKMTRQLAQLMDEHPAYGVRMREIHHVEKRDAPSGTAITTAQRLMDGLSRFNRWELSDQEAASFGEVIPIHAVREGDVKGTHEIIFESAEDVIRLEHAAKSREGFALGAVLAAEFLVRQQPGVYSMDDLLA